MRALLRSQLGSSVTEFAILAPVLVSIVLYATFFTEAFRTKIKTQEAARFAAWEFTAFPLSDYNAPGNHDSLFTAAQTAIKTDIGQIYGSFDSSLPPGSPQRATFIAREQLLTNNITFTNDVVPLSSTKSAKDIPGIGGALGMVAGLAESGLEMVDGQFKMNGKGMITVTVSSRLDNVILPTNFLDSRFGGVHLQGTTNQLAHITMTDHVAIVADAWTLHDGRDVDLNPAGDGIFGTIGQGSTAHPMAKQVAHMSFLGFGDKFGAIENIVNAIGDIVPLGDPVAKPVVSMNYSRSSSFSNANIGGAPNVGESGANHGQVNFKDGESSAEDRQMDTGIYKFHTAPFRDHQSYNNSKPYQVFKAGGQFYMGCPTAQSDDPTHCHHD